MLHTACIVEEKMIVIGGLGKDDISTADIWNFDTRLMSWSQIHTKGKSPFETKSGALKSIYGHQCAVWENKIILCGGKHDNNFNPSIWILDVFNSTWLECSPAMNPSKFPSQRWKHMICSHVNYNRNEKERRMTRDLTKNDNKSTINIYILGGMSNGIHYDDLWEFKLRLNSSTSMEKGKIVNFQNIEQQ
jgi:hypothetical protein